MFVFSANSYKYISGKTPPDEWYKNNAFQIPSVIRVNITLVKRLVIRISSLRTSLITRRFRDGVREREEIQRETREPEDKRFPGNHGVPTDAQRGVGERTRQVRHEIL